jgi:hypothetical protein
MTTTWKVSQLDCYPEYEGNTDVVFTVHWSATAQDGEFSGYTYGSASMTLDPEATFVPFADLTEAQVIGWVQDSMGEDAVAGIEANLATQIENAKNPPVVNPPLPWG